MVNISNGIYFYPQNSPLVPGTLLSRIKKAGISPAFENWPMPVLTQQDHLVGQRGLISVQLVEIHT